MLVGGGGVDELTHSTHATNWTAKGKSPTYSTLDYILPPTPFIQLSLAFPRHVSSWNLSDE